MEYVIAGVVIILVALVVVRRQDQDTLNRDRLDIYGRYIDSLKIQVEALESNAKLNLGLDQKMNDTYKRFEELSVQVQDIKNDEYQSQIDDIQEHIARKSNSVHIDGVVKMELVRKKATSVSQDDMKKLTKQVKVLSK